MTKPMQRLLIVCDVQPDVVQKLQPPPQQRRFVDMIHIAVAAARKQHVPILYTQLLLPTGYPDIPLSHPKLGILRKLGGKNCNIDWFTSPELTILPRTGERVLTRETYLPQTNDTVLLDTLREYGVGSDDNNTTITLVGFAPTVNTLANHVLGDVLAVRNLYIVQDCVADDVSEERCQALLSNGLLLHNASDVVVSLVEVLESLDLLHTPIDTPLEDLSPTAPRPVRYVCDCGRGGHLSLFLPYLVRDYGYSVWPTQPWYKESSLVGTTKEYQCPLGRRIVDLCDEPQFGSGTKFFLAGRQHLDEKDLLFTLVPELMPPTFTTVEEAREYTQQPSKGPSAEPPQVWFLKKVNQNGGRAITITHELPIAELAADEQLQVHIPRPLLYHENLERCEGGGFKCHIKTYQYLAACCSPCITDEEASSTMEWQLYMHDLFYLATAKAPWNPTDLSDDAQITTMRSHRLAANHPWRKPGSNFDLTSRIRANMTTVIQCAVSQGKLQVQHQSTAGTESLTRQSSKGITVPKAVAFEINSADWMLNEDGTELYLIEINGIPVLYDAGGIVPQPLCTKGLQFYDHLYKENKTCAAVNDHDLLTEALGLALTGKLPANSLWSHVTTITALGNN